MKVNILEVSRDDQVTDKILASYDINTNNKMLAIREAGNLFKSHELYEVLRHNYFLRVVNE